MIMIIILYSQDHNRDHHPSHDHPDHHEYHNIPPYGQGVHSPEGRRWGSGALRALQGGGQAAGDLQ